jgi:hypothetical protein
MNIHLKEKSQDKFISYVMRNVRSYIFAIYWWYCCSRMTSAVTDSITNWIFWKFLYILSVYRCTIWLFISTVQIHPTLFVDARQTQRLAAGRLRTVRRLLPVVVYTDVVAAENVKRTPSAIVTRTSATVDSAPCFQRLSFCEYALWSQHLWRLFFCGIVCGLNNCSSSEK